MKRERSWISASPRARVRKKKAAEDKHIRKGRRYSRKEREQIIADSGESSVEDAARKNGVSANTIYRWIKKAKLADAEGPPEFGGDSEEAKAGKILSSDERDEKVLELWRENPGFGPSQIKNLLKRDGFRVSVGTVKNVMVEHGYVSPKLKRKERVGRYEAARPRELYHLDFFHFHVHKQKQCLLFIQDDFSRYIAGWTLTQHESADPVIECFDKAVTNFGKPERAMSDRGSAFHSWKGLSRFQKMLEDYEINFHLAKDPEVNGKVEALNAAFQKECLRQYEFMDLSDASRTIGRWVDHYNHQRTHHGLGGILVPADRFYGISERTLKMIELGQGAHALDILNPENRGLELFRVTSHNGEPAVYLMGKKIFG